MCAQWPSSVMPTPPHCPPPLITTTCSCPGSSSARTQSWKAVSNVDDIPALARRTSRVSASGQNEQKFLPYMMVGSPNELVDPSNATARLPGPSRPSTNVGSAPGVAIRANNGSELSGLKRRLTFAPTAPGLPSRSSDSSGVIGNARTTSAALAPPVNHPPTAPSTASQPIGLTTLLRITKPSRKVFALDGLYRAAACPQRFSCDSRMRR
jgi:hypothetical protein